MNSEEPEIPADTAKLLTNRTRIEILKLLNKRRYTISELSKLLELSKPLILYHIRILEDAGFVKRVENGHKWVYYELTDIGKSMLKRRRIKIIISLFGAVALISFTVGKIGQPAEIGGVNILIYVFVFLAVVTLMVVAYFAYLGRI